MIDSRGSCWSTDSVCSNVRLRDTSNVCTEPGGCSQRNCMIPACRGASGVLVTSTMDCVPITFGLQVQRPFNTLTAASIGLKRGNNSVGTVAGAVRPLRNRTLYRVSLSGHVSYHLPKHLQAAAANRNLNPRRVRIRIDR